MIKNRSAMPKNFVRRNFDYWMRSNRHRFRHQPFIAKNRRGYFTFHFQGITHVISGHISKHGFFEIRVVFQRIFWDIIMEFDVHPCTTRNGQYFCRSCQFGYEDGATDQPPALYSSREELWAKHSFEPFLQWTEINFRPENRLCLGQVDDRSGTWAAIKHKEDIDPDKWDYVLPVVGNPA